MKRLLGIICIAKTFYHLFKTPLGFDSELGLLYKDGHDYELQKNNILKCVLCGKISK